MSEGRGWGDPERPRVGGAALQILPLLARLPLLPANRLQLFINRFSHASIYRHLRALLADGLVDSLRMPLAPGHSPRLFYLTNQGISTVARVHGIKAVDLAHQHHLRRCDLLRLLPGLPYLDATYELLAAVADSRPGQPRLLAWERPWRQRFSRPTAKTPVTVELPAYAALSWGESWGTYLLLPDLATFPLRVYRRLPGRLLDLRCVSSDDLPILVVATEGQARAEAWRQLFEDVRRVRAEAGLVARVATWERLPAGLGGLPCFEGTRRPPKEGPVPAPTPVRLGRRRTAVPLPRLAGEARGSPVGPPVSEPSLAAALRPRPADRALLDLVGRHPFLSPTGMTALLGWPVEKARQRRNRLVARGLMRLLGPEEVDARHAKMQLSELTPDGLDFLAAQQGLPLAEAVRYNGLAGGGPASPVGSRRQLIDNLAHTLGVNAVFVSLARTARRLAAAESDDALLEWRSAAACSRGRLRPDGYGIYRHGGELYGFFLEYDRGTMSVRDLLRKFAAYHDYVTTGRFARDYDGFPTILVVTTGKTAEERIARAALGASVGRGDRLPLLLTREWRIYRDPDNPDGLLGPVWREPGGTIRRCWPMRSPSASVPSRPWPPSISAPAGISALVGMSSGVRASPSEEDRRA